jgi:hypothetical protein
MSLFSVREREFAIFSAPTYGCLASSGVATKDSDHQG